MNCQTETALSSPGRRAFLYILLTAALLFPPGLRALTPGTSLETVIVQFEITPDIIQSRETYRDAVGDAMAEAMGAGPADLVIFPEYLGVFAALIPWTSALKTDRPFEEVWMQIARNNPELRSLTDLFASGSKDTDAFLDRLWGDLAREYGVYILSGTRFIYSRDQRGLMNQAVVYAPSGKEIYSQNKFFLTDFETDILGLTPGNLRDTDGFIVKDHRIRLTICRDTFLREWEQLYREGDLWIDIKANGVAYTPDQKALFTRALPARLTKTAIPFGITACLTGSFMNLLWEGESSIINNNAGEVTYLEVSEEFDEFEIIRYTFP